MVGPRVRFGWRAGHPFMFDFWLVTDLEYLSHASACLRLQLHGQLALLSLPPDSLPCPCCRAFGEGLRCAELAALCEFEADGGRVVLW